MPAGWGQLSPAALLQERGRPWGSAAPGAPSRPPPGTAAGPGPAAAPLAPGAAGEGSAGSAAPGPSPGTKAPGAAWHRAASGALGRSPGSAAFAAGMGKCEETSPAPAPCPGQSQKNEAGFQCSALLVGKGTRLPALMGSLPCAFAPAPGFSSLRVPSAARNKGGAEPTARLHIWLSPVWGQEERQSDPRTPPRPPARGHGFERSARCVPQGASGRGAASWQRDRPPSAGRGAAHTRSL